VLFGAPAAANDHLLVQLAGSLSADEPQWMSMLMGQVRTHGDQTPHDPFAIACNTIDHSLFRLVGWVRNAPFFDALEVCR
jgi:hypothetical protein